MKLPLLFRMVPSLVAYDLPLSEMGVANAPHDRLRDACCHLANMIEKSIRQLCAVPDVIMSLAIWPFVTLL